MLEAALRTAARRPVLDWFFDADKFSRAVLRK
jgi:hypothetical protein